MKLLLQRRQAAKDDLTVAPVISLRDRFPICGGGFRGDADANRVTMNDDRALIVASSPECLIVLPSPRAVPGVAKLTVDSSGTQRNATTTLVSLQFEAPQAAPAPGQRSELTVHVEGSNAPLDLTIKNETPGVLEFLKGDIQEVRTTGGSRNIAQVQISAIRSGDYSFNAKLIPLPDIPAAERYLRAAVPLAPKALQHRVNDAAGRVATHPKDREKVRAGSRKNDFHDDPRPLSNAAGSGASINLTLIAHLKLVQGFWQLRPAAHPATSVRECFACG